jgi:hypothetical protein
MQRAEELGFDFANGVKGYTKSYIPDGLGDLTEVKEGGRATLKKGDIQIEIQNITKDSAYSYMGKVSSVTPYDALEKDNIMEGTDISFSYRHIFWFDHG